MCNSVGNLFADYSVLAAGIKPCKVIDVFFDFKDSGENTAACYEFEFREVFSDSLLVTMRFCGGFRRDLCFDPGDDFDFITYCKELALRDTGIPSEYIAKVRVEERVID